MLTISLCILYSKFPAGEHERVRYEEINGKLSFKITKEQAEEIKKLVQIVSLCEKKHYNTIHNEMKKRYGYFKYREIDHSTYQKVRDTLIPRICRPKNS